MDDINILAESTIKEEEVKPEPVDHAVEQDYNCTEGDVVYFVKEEVEEEDEEEEEELEPLARVFVSPEEVHNGGINQGQQEPLVVGKNNVPAQCECSNEHSTTRKDGDRDVVHELLTATPFNERSFRERLEIVKAGKPKPSLPELKIPHKERNRMYTRGFSTANYIKYPWLTASSKNNKLYCWPCLLFSPDTSTWNQKGFNSLNYLVSACEKHQKAQTHIRAFSTLQTFGTRILDHSLNLQRKIAENLHNEKVKENKMVLRRLIDVVSFLGKQECSFRGHDESGDSTSKGMYAELIEFLAAYDLTIANHLKTSLVFRETLPTIQNGLIDAVAGVILDKIKNEISNAAFVAIILDETSDVTNKSRLSTVMRFVDNEGNCQERFLHFSDVSSDRSAQGLFQHVAKIMDEFDCSKKLVAQSYDGAVVTADQVSALQALVKNKYRSATFIHCYNHRLDWVLSKSTICIKECRRFFTTLSGITNFFSHSTVHTAALKVFMEKKGFGSSPTRWNFLSKIVNTLKEHRENLIKFFSAIEDNTDDWTPDEVNTASGFVRFLSKFETKFLILVFNKIFPITDRLFGVLRKKCMDISSCEKKTNDFYCTLKEIRENDYDSIWTEATSIAQSEDEYEPIAKRQGNVDHLEYQRIFNEIVDTLMSQIKSRFESQKELKFVSLLDSRNFEMFCIKFPQELLDELKEPFASNFDIIRLRNELNVFYTLDDYKNKSVNEITNYMKLNNLDVVFHEVYKLAELVLAFPCITAAGEGSIPSLKRIKTYLRATQGQVQLCNLAILSIEKNILLDLKKHSEEEFYENVSLKFTQKERRMDILFR